MRRAEARRSTSGLRLRSCWNPHSPNSTTAAANIDSTAGLVQPQVLPWVRGTSRLTSAALRPTAPTPSNRPPVRVRDSRMNTAAAVATAAPIAVVTQNSTCQSANWTMAAANGMPSAVPRPRVELSRATARPTRSLGSSSRRIDMPIGMTAAPAPCRPRAVMRTAMFELIAHSSDPTVIRTSATSSMRFLPTMSASRPKIGVITAPTSRVAVTSHDTAVVPAPVSAGMLGSSGTMTVCMIAWKIAPTARIGKTKRDGRGATAVAAPRAGGPASDRSGRDPRSRRGWVDTYAIGPPPRGVNNCLPG